MACLRLPVSVMTMSSLIVWLVATNFQPSPNRAFVPTNFRVRSVRARGGRDSPTPLSATRSLAPVWALMFERHHCTRENHMYIQHKGTAGAKG